MQVPDLAEVRRVLRSVRNLRRRLRGEVDVEALVADGLQLGRGVYLAPWVLLDHVAPYLISIGDWSTLAPRVHVLTHDASAVRALGYTRLAAVHIGRGVFIGADTLILPGVTIGDGSVVGAGSLVSTDIPAGSLAVGRPAVVMGTSEDFFERRKQRIALGTKFELKDRATASGRARIRAEVERNGEAFIP